MNKTQIKGIICSVLLFLLMLIVFYQLKISYLAIANTAFLVGLIYITIGCLTRAYGIFSGTVYLTKKIYANVKKEKQYFKTYSEYLTSRENLQIKERSISRLYIIIGLSYIILSIIMS